MSKYKRTANKGRIVRVDFTRFRHEPERRPRNKYPWLEMEEGEQMRVSSVDIRAVRVAAYKAGRDLRCHFSVHKLGPNECVVTREDRRAGVNWGSLIVGEWFDLPGSRRNVRQSAKHAERRWDQKLQVRRLVVFKDRMPVKIWRVKRVK